jgi:hypothetical protein
LSAGNRASALFTHNGPATSIANVSPFGPENRQVSAEGRYA